MQVPNDEHGTMNDERQRVRMTSAFCTYRSALIHTSRMLKNNMGAPARRWFARHGQQENTGRMLKKARLLTRPTLARRDAPSPKQGRSERRGEAYASVR